MAPKKKTPRRNTRSKPHNRKPGQKGRGRPGVERDGATISQRIIAPHDADPGSETAGQSGDLQGLSNLELAESESVAELLEEGQAFEASVVSGVENAPDADQSEVITREVPEDDVPPGPRRENE